MAAGAASSFHPQCPRVPPIPAPSPRVGPFFSLAHCPCRQHLYGWRARAQGQSLPMNSPSFRRAWSPLNEEGQCLEVQPTSLRKEGCGGQAVSWFLDSTLGCSTKGRDSVRGRRPAYSR